MSDFTKQTEEMVKAAQKMQVPESVQHMAEKNLENTRKAYDNMTDVAQSTSKSFEKVYEAAQKNSKKLAEKLLENLQTNSEATIEFVESIAQCKTLQEMTNLQAEFVQEQIKAFGGQQKDLYALTNKVTADTFKSINDAAAKSLSQIRAAN